MGFWAKLFDGKVVEISEANDAVVLRFADALATSTAEFTSVEIPFESKLKVDLAFREVLSRKLTKQRRSDLEVCYLSLADFQDLNDEQLVAISNFDLAVQNRDTMETRKMVRMPTSSASTLDQIRRSAMEERLTYLAVIEAIRVNAE